jgi:hypothetical protein
LLSRIFLLQIDQQEDAGQKNISAAIFLAGILPVAQNKDQSRADVRDVSLLSSIKAEATWSL